MIKMTKKDIKDLLEKYTLDYEANKRAWLNDTRSYQTYAKIKGEIQERMSDLKRMLGEE